MTKRRRHDSQHLDDAREHLRVLQEHLSRGSLDDALIRAEAPEDWPKMVGMRNMLAHQYADLDREILQNTIDNRLEGFIRLVDRLRKPAMVRSDG